MKYIRTCPKCKTDYPCKDKSVLYRHKRRICRVCWKLKRKDSKQMLKRKCPTCHSELYYTNYKNFWRATKENAKCRRCSKMGNPSRRGQKCSSQHKLKVAMSNMGKIMSRQARQKMRLAAIRRMNRLGITQCRSYNPKACLFFDQLNKTRSWNLQHAENGGEIQVEGYFLDAYDKKQNVVVEYDEPSHNKPSKKQKDDIRQKEIVDALHCDFYRYNESTSQLSKT